MLIFLRAFLLGLFSLLNADLLQAGSWKASLEFDIIEGQPTTRHINAFHLGLHDLERDTTQIILTTPEVVDNIGNRFQRGDAEGAAELIESAKNTTNVALASLQIIYREKAGDPFKFHFVHLYRTTHERTTATRIFRSGGGGHLSTEASAHLLKKCGSSGEGLPSRPDRLDLLATYHLTPHAEDKVFYVLNTHYKGILRAAWESINPARGSLIDAVIFHMHSRLDMCGNCAYALDWELNESGGFGRKIVDYVCGAINRDHRHHVRFGALVSSRQDYLVWGPSRRTLPSGPPMAIGISAELVQAYRETIRLDTLSARRQYAQAVVPLFQIAPPNPQSSYHLAWNANGGAYPIAIPPATVPAEASGGGDVSKDTKGAA